MPLTKAQRRAYREAGHVTVPGVFSVREMEDAIADVESWGREFLAGLDEKGRAWYVDASVTAATVLRKLDNPVHARPAFRRLAAHPGLVDLVEDVIGRGVTVYFSQVFLKPPHGGGPKPVHQDNYYFGPSDPEGVVTAWIALDEATIDNGCLQFGEGSHRGPVHPHVAPPGRDFDLQVPPDVAALQPMTPAPVPRGGVSLHHGNVFHQSADNRSSRWRRASAFHYVRNEVTFDRPALAYEPGIAVRIT